MAEGLTRVTLDGTEVVETLLATVHLAADRVYKRRHALRTPFVDQRTAQQRRALCEEEVRLNRELAPGVHLGVRALVERDGVLEVADAGEAGDAAVDHVVEMVRLDAGRALPELVRRGAAREELGEELGARLAAFHASADRAPGTTAAFEAIASVNAAELADAARGLTGVTRVDDLRAMLLDGLAARREEFHERERRGLAVDGHGDLRAEHVFACDDGIKVIDRLEFDATLRRADVAADLAFLLMDLERLGARGLGEAVVRGYAAAGGDPGDRALLALFGVHRALVRAKVALLRARRGERAALPDAEDHLALAGPLAWRATCGGEVLVVCGPPASGKSTLAAAVARRSGRPVLSTDVVRKARLGLAPTERAPAGAYAADRTLAVYRELGLEAARRAAAGEDVLVDGTFGGRSLRRALLAPLRASGRRVRFVECRVPHAELVRRAGLRMRSDDRVSDADVAVAETLEQRFEALAEIPAADHVVVRTDQPVTALVGRLERWLAAPVPERLRRLGA